MWKVVRVIAGLTLVLGAAVAAADAVQIARAPAWAAVRDGQARLAGLSARPRVVEPNWLTTVGMDPSLAAAMVSVEVSEKADGDRLRWRVRYVLNLPAGSPVLARIRHGDAAGNAYFLVQELAGRVEVGGVSAGFGAPLVIQRAGTGNARVTVDGTIWTDRDGGPWIVVEPPGSALADYARHPDRTVTIQVPDLQVRAVAGPAPVEQSARGVTFRTEPGDPPAAASVSAEGSTDPDARTPSVRVSGRVWQAVRSLWFGLLGVLAWLVLYLAGRHGRLGSSARVTGLVRLTGLLLLAHAAYRILAALATLEYWLLYAHDSRLAESLRGHGWSVANPGTIVVSVLGVGAGLPIVIGRWRRRFTRVPPAGAVSTQAMAAPVLVVLLVGVSVPLTRPTLEGRLAGVDNLSGYTALTLAGCAVAGCLGAALAGRWRLWPYCLLGTAGVGLFAGASPVTDLDGPLATALRLAVVIGMGAAGLAALLSAGWTGWTARSGGRLRRTPGRGARWGTALLVVACVVPIARDRGSPVSWYFLANLPFKLDRLATLVLVVVVIRLIRDELASPDPGAVARMRLLGLSFGLLTFVSATATLGQLPVAFLTAAVLLWWFALRPAAPSFGPPLGPRRRDELVDALLRARSAERSLPRLRRSLRGKVESGEMTYAEAERTATALQRVADDAPDAAGLRRGPAGVAGQGLAEAALGSYRLTPAWRQATAGALAGFVLGLPWAVLAVPALTRISPASGPYALLDLAGSAPFALRWTAYGFFFGAFFPLLRGSTGLAKGGTLFLTLAMPTALVTLPTGGFTSGNLRTLVFTLSQLFIHAVLLGLGADLVALRRAGHRADRLVDVHNLRAIAAWGSGLVAATGAAISTALASGVTAVVIGLLQPATPNQQPGPPPKDASQAEQQR